MGPQMEPIIILGQPRSGSSMTAGLFAAHGVWVGTCRPPGPWNAKGFFENVPVKKIIINMHKAIVRKGIIAQKTPGFRAAVLEAIKADGYSDGPWLWKGSAMYWPAFFEFEPRFVVVNRPRDQIFSSTRKSKMLNQNETAEQLYANIDFHQQQMDYLVTYKQAARVNTYDLIRGDFASIERAFIHAQVDYDEKIARDFVEPKLWRHGLTS